jgi:hypothetical protein
MSNASKAKNCPFCGSKADGVRWFDESVNVTSVCCSNKDCIASFKSVELEVWNSRADTTPTTQREADERAKFIAKMRDDHEIPDFVPDEMVMAGQSMEYRFEGWQARAATGQPSAGQMDERALYDDWWHEGAHPFRDISKRKNCQLNEETAWMVWQAARASLTPTAPAIPAAPVELMGVREEMEKGSGFWSSCSGCYDTEDGHPTGPYSYSHVFGCALGSGCSECGGIGAVWDNTDYEDMVANDTPTAPQAAEEQLRRMRAAFHINMLRAFPDKTHTEIGAEIDKACGAAPQAASPAQNEGVWPWDRRAEAAEAFMRNYADTNMEELLGGYHVQPIIRRLAAAIKEWQADAVKEAPDGVVGIDIPVAAPQAVSQQAEPVTGDKPAKLPWRITESPRKIVGADGATVANLTALDLPNAHLIVESVNRAAPQAATTASAPVPHHFACERRGYNPLCAGCEAERAATTASANIDNDEFWNHVIAYCKGVGNEGQALVNYVMSWHRAALAAPVQAAQPALPVELIYQVEQQDGDWYDSPKDFWETMPVERRRIVTLFAAPGAA